MSVDLSELALRWREKADDLRPFAPGAAEAFEVASRELEECLAQSADEVLTLEQAAAESEYSADHLGALVRDGKLPNAGRKHAPGIRRRDLPRKPRRPQQGPALVEEGAGGPTLARITRDALSSRTPGR